MFREQESLVDCTRVACIEGLSTTARHAQDHSATAKHAQDHSAATEHRQDHSTAAEDLEGRSKVSA